MTPQHDHPDASRLTFGCPACTERVRQDREATRWRDAPLRRVTWSVACGRYGTAGLTADVRVPDKADPWQVEEWHAGVLGTMLHEWLVAAGVPNWPEYMGSDARCIIGPVVEDVTAVAPVEHPSLFEVPAS